MTDQELKAAREAFKAFKKALMPVLKASDIDAPTVTKADRFLDTVSNWMVENGVIRDDYGPGM